MFTAIFAERNSIDNPTNLLYLPFEEIRTPMIHALEIGLILVADRVGHTRPQMVLKADLERRIGTLTEWENPIQKSLELIGRPYIDDCAVFIFVNVTTRASRQELQF